VRRSVRGRVIGVLEALSPHEGIWIQRAAGSNRHASIAGTAIRHAQLFERLRSAHQLPGALR
jgi:hypothetical protein